MRPSKYISLYSDSNMLKNLEVKALPFRHFISQGESLPIGIAHEIVALANPSDLLGDIGSRSDYANRTFLKKDKFPEYSEELRSFLNHITSKDFSRYCEEYFGVDLEGSALRAEVVCDVSGFFQVPPTDVGDKRITWLTYLGDISENGDVGTDLFNADLSWHSAAPWGFNNALVFKPGANTFHGFVRTKKIVGLRKVLIINFVDNWKDKHELFE